MNRSPALVALIPAMATFLALYGNAARASDLAEAHAIKAHVPQTEAARKWADLITRTEHALGGYVAACASGNEQALRHVTTDDLHVEYTLGEPGTYLVLDSGTSPAGCAAMGGLVTRTSDVWIFPTNSAAVFVQFDVPSQRQLALVEMRGDRIARIVNFSAPPPAMPKEVLSASNE